MTLWLSARNNSRSLSFDLLRLLVFAFRSKSSRNMKTTMSVIGLSMLLVLAQSMNVPFMTFEKLHTMKATWHSWKAKGDKGLKYFYYSSGAEWTRASLYVIIFKSWVGMVIISRRQMEGPWDFVRSHFFCLITSIDEKLIFENVLTKTDCQIRSAERGYAVLNEQNGRACVVDPFSIVDWKAHNWRLFLDSSDYVNFTINERIKRCDVEDM